MKSIGNFILNHTGLFLLLVVIVIAVIIAIPGSNDWDDFELYSAADKRGEAFSCSDLVNAKMNHGSIGDSHKVDVIDYIYYTGYEFKSCSTELEKMIAEQCATPLWQTINRMKKDGDFWLGSKAKHFCSDLLIEKISIFSDRYELPTEASPFLLVATDEEITLINPIKIGMVSFKELIPSELWMAEVKTAEKVHRLLFPQKDKWQAAQNELKTLPLYEEQN